MVIDSHIHIIVPEIERQSDPDDSWRPAVRWEEGQQLCNFGGRTINSMLREMVDIERMLEENDKAGVDRVVLTPWSSLFGYNLDLEKSIAINRIQNDALARLQADHSARVAALGTIPMQDTGAAIAELEHVMKVCGLKGIEIGTNVNGAYLGDDQFRPIWEAAQDLGAVIEVHPVPGVGGKTKGQYYLWNAWANPAETAFTAAHFIAAGVLESYPALKMVWFHGGGHLPYQIGRLDRAYEMRPELQKRITRPPSTYLRQCYFDTITHSGPALTYLIDLVGAGQVMVGSDYPFDMGYDRPADLVQSLSLSAAEEAQILYQTAEALFWGETAHE